MNSPLLNLPAVSIPILPVLPAPNSLPLNLPRRSPDSLSPSVFASSPTESILLGPSVGHKTRSVSSPLTFLSLCSLLPSPPTSSLRLSREPFRFLDPQSRGSLKYIEVTGGFQSFFQIRRNLPSTTDFSPTLRAPWSPFRVRFLRPLSRFSGSQTQFAKTKALPSLSHPPL